MEQDQLQKAEFNKLIKDHLKYNKKIVMTLMNHKVEEESRSFKDKLGVSHAPLSNSPCSTKSKGKTSARKMQTRPTESGWTTSMPTKNANSTSSTNFSSSNTSRSRNSSKSSRNEKGRK